jgi:hypothetical protein
MSARVRSRPKLGPHAGLAVPMRSHGFAGVRSAWLRIWHAKVTRNHGEVVPEVRKGSSEKQ